VQLVAGAVAVGHDEASGLAAGVLLICQPPQQAPLLLRLGPVHALHGNATIGVSCGPRPSNGQLLPACLRQPLTPRAAPLRPHHPRASSTTPQRRRHRGRRRRHHHHRRQGRRGRRGRPQRRGQRVSRGRVELGL
jgi:hypothetical protein